MWVDYERAWLMLAQLVETKRSHGQDGLRQEMARIQAECIVEEPPPPWMKDGTTGTAPAEAAEAAEAEMSTPLLAEEARHGTGHTGRTAAGDSRVRNGRGSGHAATGSRDALG